VKFPAGRHNRRKTFKDLQTRPHTGRRGSKSLRRIQTFAGFFVFEKQAAAKNFNLSSEEVMTRKNQEEAEPEAPGGKAAERLREFMAERFPDETALPDQDTKNPDLNKKEIEREEQPAAKKRETGCESED
jgi:hypothetical protein